MKMLTILTEEAPPLFPAIHRNVKQSISRFKSRLIGRKNIPLYGGHFGVTRSLLEGLRILGVPYRYNPSINRITDTVIVLSNLAAVTQAIDLKRQGKIKKLIIGPNLVILPSDAAHLTTAPEVDRFIVNSNWVKDMYAADSHALKDRLVVWAAGVNEHYWQPTRKEKTNNILFYYKTGPRDLYEICKEKAKQAGYEIIELEYGNKKNQYTLEQYRALLEQASLAVFWSESESQGIALFEAWAMNVPTLVWDRGYAITQNTGRRFPASAAPYVTNETGVSFSSSTEFSSLLDQVKSATMTFNPRTWVLEHGTDRIAARQLISIINSA